MEFMMPCTLTRFPGPFEEKQPDNITEPPPYLHTGYFWDRHYSFYTKPLFHLTMVPVKVSVAFSELQVLIFVVK